MTRGKSGKHADPSAAAPQGFDDFALRLGDVMRGERATMGKSLLDVQRELRIRASYIAAIENCDPQAFDTPGFIAGYVRSYARYLGMDPEDAFTQFCNESGFRVAHGMSDKASTMRKPQDGLPRKPARDPLLDSRTPFAAREDTMFSRIEPGAIGSTLVLLALIGGIGFGGYSVLREVQRVQVTPVDQTPLVLSELDPLDGAQAPSMAPSADPAREADGVAGVFSPPTQDWYDRLQRPEALDTPVLVARDAPISTLDPDDSGLFAGQGPRVDAESLPQSALAGVPRAPAAAPGDVAVVAVRPAFVRITDRDGAVLFSGILDGGESFPVPAGVRGPRIDVGESGAVFFAVNGTAYGPAGPSGSVTDDIPLDPSAVTRRYAVADGAANPALATLVAGLAGPAPETSDPIAAAIAALDTPGAMPRVTADAPAGVTIVATREVWVRVRAASGATLYETVMQAGDTYRVPQTETPPTIRAGDAGAVYFAVNGQTFGPYGGNGAVADNLALSANGIADRLARADLGANDQLARIVAELGIPRP